MDAYASVGRRTAVRAAPADANRRAPSAIFENDERLVRTRLCASVELSLDCRHLPRGAARFGGYAAPLCESTSRPREMFLAWLGSCERRFIRGQPR
jgi:hypothetical protein